MGNAQYKAATCPATIDNHMIHAGLSVIMNVIPFLGPALDGLANKPPPNMQPALDSATANLTALTMNWQNNITQEVVKIDVDLNNLMKTINGDGSDGSDYASITSKYALMHVTENVTMLDINVFFLGLVVSLLVWYLLRNKTS
jgi:hypothetical protein